MNNSVLEIKLTQSDTIVPGEKVVFNEPLLSPPGIEYDKTSGIITFKETGQFLIKWWVATETTLKRTIAFELESSQQSFVSAPGSSPIKTGQVTGFGVIDVEEVDTTLSLVNKSFTDTVISTRCGTKAYLLITPIYPKPRMEAYHFNLSRFNSTKDIQIKNVIYRLTRRSSGNFLDLFLGPVDSAVQIDYRRLTIFDDVATQGRRADSYNLGSFINIDDGLYIDTNELNTVWLRQKDPAEDKYSTCVIRYWAGGPNASRVEVWVEWISEDVTYGAPL